MRFLLTTLGSLGDLHPYLSIGSELLARGHEVVVATSPGYRERVEGLGIEFAPLGPDLPDPELDAEIMVKAMDARRGTQYVIREWMLPHLRTMFVETQAAAEGCDAFVSHPLTLATKLVAELRGIPLASVAIAPVAFFSAYDPPVLPFPWPFNWISQLGPPGVRMTRWVANSMVHRWLREYQKLRHELKLPPSNENPVLTDPQSKTLVLALFSPLFARPQADWPVKTVQTGFPFHDESHLGSLAEPMEAFLSAGEPPLIFTLGSAAVRIAGDFYETSQEVAVRLGKRAIFLVGPLAGNAPSRVDPSHLVVEYAPFAALLPRGLMTIHQGGIGTTGQALRSGRPMLVVPFAHDQPDNATRITRMGVGNWIPRRSYNVARATKLISRILDTPSCFEKAALVGQQIGQERGAIAAALTLEEWAGATITSAGRPDRSRI
ncbi:MAG: glycosyltransferase [Planctomyces sp.]|nr:glycosyltransferase [Planctomyces sp.]